MGVLKLPKLGLPQLWSPITLRANLGSRCGLKQSCNPRRELSNKNFSFLFCTPLLLSHVRGLLYSPIRCYLSSVVVTIHRRSSQLVVVCRSQCPSPSIAVIIRCNQHPLPFIIIDVHYYPSWSMLIVVHCDQRPSSFIAICHSQRPSPSVLVDVHRCPS